MSNTAIKLGTINYPFVKNSYNPNYAHLISIVYDTPNEDLVIFTPKSTKHCGIVGVDIVPSADSYFTFKTGNSILSMPFIPRSGGYSKSVDDSVLFPCLVGESLKFRSNQQVDTGVFYIIEF